MKKLLGIILFLFLSVTAFASSTDRYPFTVTTDNSDFTTSVGQFWRWLETRIHFESNVTATIFHIVDSGDNINHDAIIETSYINATKDVVIYPGSTDDTATVLLRDTDELKISITSTSVKPHVTIVGEKI